MVWTNDFKLIIATIGAALCFGFGAGIVAEDTIKIGKYDAGPQLVMVINHTKPDGEKVVIVKEVVPVLGLVDAPEQHSAPLSDGTHLLCRTLFEYRNEAGQPAFAFACGNDTYVTKNIALVPKKDVKNAVGGKDEQ